MLIEDVNEEGPAGAALATPGMKPLLSRLLMVAAALASVVVLVGAVLLVLRLAQPPDYPLSGRSPDGEISGRLAQLESGVILVQPEAPGSSLVPLLLSKGTRIKVGTQEGWVGDLRAGDPITVTYELFEGKRLAQTVALPDTALARPAEASRKASEPLSAQPAAPTRPAAPVSPVAPAQPAAPAQASTPTQPPTPAQPAVPAKAAAPAQAAAPVQLPAPARPAVLKPVAPSDAAPAPVAGPGPAPAPAPAAVEARRPPRPTAPAATAPQPAPPVREPERTRDAESADGSAAVDWLLNNRR